MDISIRIAGEAGQGFTIWSEQGYASLADSISVQIQMQAIARKDERFCGKNAILRSRAHGDKAIDTLRGAVDAAEIALQPFGAT